MTSAPKRFGLLSILIVVCPRQPVEKHCSAVSKDVLLAGD